MPRKTMAQVIGMVLLVATPLTAGCLGEEGEETFDDEIAAEEGEGSADESVGSTTQALTVLGGIDLDQQCRRRHGSSAFAVLLQPVFSPGAAYAWRCYQNGVYHHIDMRLFCVWQYNNFNAVDAFSDFNNAYSWYCYLP